MRLALAVGALLVAAACAAGADSVLPEEIGRYYEAWELLATMTTVDDRRAAMEPGEPAEKLRWVRDAMALVEAAELPFSPKMRVTGGSGRWLRRLPRYEARVERTAPDGRTMVIACRATLGGRSELFQPADDPRVFPGRAKSSPGRFSLGTELHQWVKTEAGWKRRSPTPILVD